MKKIVNMAAVGLMMLSLGGCSSKVTGPFSGKVRASGLIDNVIDGVKYSDKKSWSDEDSTAIALVKDDKGERIVSLEDVSFLNSCVGLKENQPNQSCGISIDGRGETLEFDGLNITPASAVGPGGAMISIQGITKQSKTYVDLLFSGVPYDGKK